MFSQNMYFKKVTILKNKTKTNYFHFLLIFGHLCKFFCSKTVHPYMIFVFVYIKKWKQETKRIPNKPLPMVAINFKSLTITYPY